MSTHFPSCCESNVTSSHDPFLRDPLTFVLSSPLDSPHPGSGPFTSCPLIVVPSPVGPSISPSTMPGSCFITLKYLFKHVISCFENVKGSCHLRAIQGFHAGCDSEGTPCISSSSLPFLCFPRECCFPVPHAVSGTELILLPLFLCTFY